MPEPASERLQCHSATAKQYCSSSSFVARQPRASTWPDQTMVVTGIIQRHQQPALPQAIKLTNAEGRSCISVPITQDGIDSQGYVFGPDDE